jgi:ABC-type Na+ efflux pump permease subunit
MARLLGTCLASLAWTFAAWGTYLSITEGTPNGAGWLNSGIAFILAFGLLIVAATAPTALAEERARGSLDVLLATPLVTHEIVAAKWWGVYRRVLLMLPLFLYVGAFEAATMPDLPAWLGVVRTYPQIKPLTTSVRLLVAIYTPADFLASGALIVSLGVAVATWVRRVGRSITLSVIAFLVLGLVWPIAAELSFIALQLWSLQSSEWYWKHQWLQQVLPAFSPIVGPMAPLYAFSWHVGKGTPFWAGLGVMITIKAALAWLLFQLTVCTFDRGLGRIPESPRRISVSGPLPRPEAPGIPRAGAGTSVGPPPGQTSRSGHAAP